MENLTIQDITQLITAAGIVLGIVAGAVAWLTSVYRKVSGIYTILEIIQKEFSPNGGATLRDSINLISHNQSKILSVQHVMQSFIDRTFDVPMMVVDRSGRCSWANKSYLAMVDREIEDVYDGLWESTIHYEDRDFVREEWYNACEEGRSFEITYRLNNKNEEPRHVRCTVYGDTHTGYVAFFEKISGSAEFALKKIVSTNITN